MYCTKIYGPPGTGKTQKLLEWLGEELQRVPARACAYMSFTRQGTYEGVRRAVEKWHFKAKDCRYFKTMHAICFHELGYKRRDILSHQDFVILHNLYGLDLAPSAKDLSHDFRFMQRKGENRYLCAIAIKQHNEAMFYNTMDDINNEKLQYITELLQAYKKEHNKVDFTDILTEYLRRGEPLPVEVVFLDEAQDLTVLQWQVFYKMVLKAKRVYLAGDDDQAIYEWAGVERKFFIKFPATDTIKLEQSYRLPKSINNLAQNIISHVTKRVHKTTTSTEEDGSIYYIPKWTAMFPWLQQGEVLILAREHKELRRAAQALRELGFPYTYNGKYSVDKHIFRAIELYTRMSQGVATERELHLLQLYAPFFECIDKAFPWTEVLLPQQQVPYYQALIQRGYIREEYSPRIHLSTIHSAKGTECDTVILSLDFDKKVHATYMRDADSELRCLYVGISRAKKTLVIKQRERHYGYPEELFFI